MEPFGNQLKQAEKRKDAEPTSPPSPKKHEPGTMVAIPGLIHGVSAESPTSGPGSSSKSEASPVPDWVAVWGPSIAEYFAEQRNSKQIKGVDKNFPGFKAAFGKLEGALIDPDVPAATCRQLLRAVRVACRKPDAHELASSFPTGTETNVLEFVNVKVLWSRGDVSLTPGVGVKTLNKDKQPSTMFPDYATPSLDVVGDHVRVAKPSATVGELVGFIASDTKDKLTTYPALQVRVLVDTIPSGASAQALAENSDEAKKAIIAQMKKSIPAEILKQLNRADILLSDKVVVVVERADLG